jgi:hypothetical protein
MSTLRATLTNLLAQYAERGITTYGLTQLLPKVDRGRIGKMLRNMRMSEIAHQRNCEDGGAARWYPGINPFDPDEPVLTSADHKRIQNARQMDNCNPIRLYGSDLPGGRCASVWVYANSFKDAQP